MRHVLSSIGASLVTVGALSGDTLEPVAAPGATQRAVATQDGAQRRVAAQDRAQRADAAHGPAQRGVAARNAPQPAVSARHASKGGVAAQDGSKPVVAHHAPQPVAAQDSPERTITLDDALRIATGSNPDYRREMHQLDLAGPQKQLAIGRFLPALRLSVSTAQGFVRQAIGTDDFGRPVPNPDVRTSYTSSSRQGLSLDWTLFDGLRRFRQLDEQEARATVWIGAASARLAQLAGDVERTFFEAQLRRELVAVEREILRVRDRVREATERLFRLADKSRTDVLGARVEVQRQEKNLADQVSEYRRAMLRLRRYLGVGELGAFDIAETPLEVFDPSTLDVDELVRVANERNPSVVRDEAELALAAAKAGAVSGTRWPSLTVSGHLSRAEWGVDQTALFDLAPGTQSSGALQLALSWEIFDGFDRRYKIAAADVTRRQAEETLRATRLDVEGEVRARFIELETAYANLATVLGAQELARERLRLVGEEYLLAVRTFEELQYAVQSSADASRELVQARFDFVSARIALEQALGAGLTH